jgi:hypothetical protein
MEACQRPDLDDWSVESSSDEVVPTGLAEDEDECTIDTSQLSTQDLDRMRHEDSFMYHSIMAKIRKMNLAILDFTSDEEVAVAVAAILGLNGSPDAAVGNVQSDLVNGRTLVGNGSDSSNQANAYGRVSSSTRQRHHSLQPAPSLSSSHQRRLSQSFSGFSTGVVTRKRRISVETALGQEMIELAASLRSSEPIAESVRRPSTSSEMSDLTRLFDFDEDDDQDGLDLSFLRPE